MQNGITIRLMRVDDLDRVYELERKSFPNPWPKSFFENDLKAKKTIAFVVERKGTMIGYSFASFDGEKFHISNIAVDEECQRKGIGSKLMQKVEDEAIEKGCRYAYLEVRLNNTAAVNMYRNLGYSISRIHKCYYIDGDDAYVMVKELK